jgi:hypothetical protein
VLFARRLKAPESRGALNCIWETSHLFQFLETVSTGESVFANVDPVLNFFPKW